MSHTITWDNLNSAGPIFDFDKIIKDGVFSGNLLLEKLMSKKVTHEGGQYVTSPIFKGKSNVRSYSKMDSWTPSDKEILDTAEWPIAHYIGEIVVAYTDLLANAGAKKNFDLVEAKYQNLIETMRYYLSTALYSDGQATATDAKPLIGLKAAVDEDPTTNPTMGAYGSITRAGTAATAYWANQISDQSAMGLAGFSDTAILQTLWGLCSDGNIHPDIIVTNQTIYNKAYDVADARQRLGNEAAAKLGYSSIDFNGVPLMVDNNCPAGYLYMLNSDTIQFDVDSSDNFKAHPFLQGIYQMAQVKYVTWSGQLKCDNPRRNGVMFGLV